MTGKWYLDWSNRRRGRRPEWGTDVVEKRRLKYFSLRRWPWGEVTEIVSAVPCLGHKVVGAIFGDHVILRSGDGSHGDHCEEYCLLGYMPHCPLGVHRRFWRLLLGVPRHATEHSTPHDERRLCDRVIRKGGDKMRNSVRVKLSSFAMRWLRGAFGRKGVKQGFTESLYTEIHPRSAVAQHSTETKHGTSFNGTVVIAYTLTHRPPLR